MFVIDDICLVCLYTLFYCFFFFFSSRRRHTRCALVTGVQTCALPILRHDRIVAVGRFAAVTKTWQIECDQAAGAAQKRRDLRPVVLVGADTMHHHQWLAAAAVEIGDLETRTPPAPPPAPPAPPPPAPPAVRPPPQHPAPAPPPPDPAPHPPPPPPTTP